MNKIKFFIVAAALVVSSTSYAQFSNANVNQRNTRTSLGPKSFDGNGSRAGYKGFLEGGYTIGVGDYGEDRIALETIHGYQFNPYYFVGFGVGVNYFIEDEYWGMPIFADIRTNLLNRRVTPILEAKIGYSVLDIQGFYVSPSIGCRIAVGNNKAIFVSIGYEMQRAEFEGYKDSYSFDGSYHSYHWTGKENCGGSTFKVGFEF